MQNSVSQLKARIKNLAKSNNTDPRILIRIYMMERFLERISISKYKNSFIIKGGLLVTSMIGISLRSTMDIDTSIVNLKLEEKNISKIINEIIEIDLEDKIKFEVQAIDSIMDEMEYPGIRLSIVALKDEMIIPFKIDISTGDAITPEAIEYKHNLLLENRSISLYSYNLETIFSEKIQTILVRERVNTRMRDFYDTYILFKIYKSKIDYIVLKKAYLETCKNRKSLSILGNESKIIEIIENSLDLKKLWIHYQQKYAYAENVSYEDVIKTLKILLNNIL